ncbi:hypothetical protein A2572_01810 [Candidatus Collierbacteria bacterium RIFOXYD1_FULL_40_9]|uniref:Uncharacterized protein n=1 Tax=Candidatus Collierbacteria bacterium RIFOXYD1_FULL_40_9 TaxID=1817731 RepID=A0A1F5FV04_9BACT|nr:MAG: hypothetical protein A2572_01810 [Candidatus Collierbacteria bacterium RIFOXYD1_FULL_40_9]
MKNFFNRYPWAVYVPLGIITILLCIWGIYSIWYNYYDVSFVPGKVEGFSWQMDIKEYHWEAVSYSDWWDEIPYDGYGEWCYEKERTITIEHTDGTTEDVTFDDDYCNYYVDEWVYYQTISNSNTDKNPAYSPIPVDTSKVKYSQQPGVFTVHFVSDTTGTIHFSYDRATWDAFREGMSVQIGVSRKGTVPYPPELPR